MQGLVTIDFGNTNPHAGLFQKYQNEWQLLKIVPWSKLQFHLDMLGMNPSNTSMVLCEVKPRPEEIQSLKEQGFLITHLKEYWRGERFAGMRVNYSKSLGEDRLIQSYFIYKKHLGNCLIIDAGTFVTMDVLTKSGFEGGYIIPGLHSYFGCFQNGHLLQGVTCEGTPGTDLPQETSSAMRDSYFAFAALAQKLISDYSLTRIILTGGNYEVWKIVFGHNHFDLIVQEEPHLIHWSLHFWMTSQIEIL